jgi:hypothetical protein
MNVTNISITGPFRETNNYTGLAAGASCNISVTLYKRQWCRAACSLAQQSGVQFSADRHHQRATDRYRIESRICVRLDFQHSDQRCRLCDLQ